MDVNGTYRDLFPNCTYVGVDCVPGRNVDRIGDAYALPFAPDTFDLVISGNVLEHLEMPLLAVQEMKRVARTGGWVLVVAPYSVGEHRYPEDHFRFLPDAFTAFLCGLDDVRTGIRVPEGGTAGHDHSDTWGIGRKPARFGGERWRIADLRTLSPAEDRSERPG